MEVFDNEKLKDVSTDIIDASIIDGKAPNNYKSIIENGFNCFKNVVDENHHFFLILGNHDADEQVMTYEIKKTYEGATITTPTTTTIPATTATTATTEPINKPYLNII